MIDPSAETRLAGGRERAAGQGFSDGPRASVSAAGAALAHSVSADSARLADQTKSSGEGGGRRFVSCKNLLNKDLQENMFCLNCLVRGQLSPECLILASSGHENRHHADTRKRASPPGSMGSKKTYAATGLRLSAIAHCSAPRLPVNANGLQEARLPRITRHR